MPPARPRRTSAPACHTSSPLLATALARLAQQCGLSRVVDVRGRRPGELLNALSDVDPGLALVGVDVVARPATLTERARWLRSPGAAALPATPDLFDAALVVAHEWLDDVPCPVVELDPAGGWRQVEVDPVTGGSGWGRPRRTTSGPG